jgi:hypothetical protein
MKFRDLPEGESFTSVKSGYNAKKLSISTNLSRIIGGDELPGLELPCGACGATGAIQNAVLTDGTERTIHMCPDDDVMA